MEDENNATTGWQEDPVTGRKWRPITEDEIQRANKIYADLEEADRKEQERQTNEMVTGHYIDQNGRGYQIRKDAYTGQEYHEPVAGFGYNNESRSNPESLDSEESNEMDQKVIDEIARKLIHAHVFSLNPLLAKEYAAMRAQQEQGKITEEEFQKTESKVISFLNQANAENFASHDERGLVQQAKRLARIDDDSVRNERIHELIDPLLEE